jgi:release factor glutamine methyltransferase
MNETELLFTQVLNCDRMSLYANKDRPLTSAQAAFISSSLKRRIKGEPMQYILGKTEFMGLEFKLNKDVLIPRPETEILVEASLSYLGTPLKPKLRVSPYSNDSLGGDTLPIDSKGVPKVLDVGTGSGCIAVSIAKMLPDVEVTASDVSQEALDVAKENARFNGVKIKFICSELFRALPADFDLIISNPPYIPREQIRELAPELKYEPFIALSGGNDGLEFYRKIIKEAPDHLKDEGILIMEMGFNQRKDIEDIFRGLKYFNIIKVIKDYNNIDRVIVAKKGR